MNKTIRKFDMSALRLIALACIATMAAGAVQAETSPYYVGGSQRLTHNSNVFLNADSASPQSDNISSTGIKLGIDQPIGRQRLNASLSANLNRYSHLSSLNNTDYALDARLDWETIERLSGNIVIGSHENLAVDQAALTTGKRNLQRVDNLGVQANMGLVTMWNFDAGVAYARSTYSESSYAVNNSTQQSINAGVRVIPGSGLSLRVGVRHANVNFPNANNSVNRNDLDFTSTLTPDGFSSYNARFSLTRQKYAASDRTISGWTGALGWAWKPTGKLSTNVTLTRDNSNGNYDFTAGALSIGTSNSVMATTLGVAAQWALTSKINVSGNLSQSWRSLDNSLNITNIGGASSSADDRTSSFGLNMQYALMRNVDLGCGVTWSERSVSSTTTGLTAPYNATTYSCFGQALLR